jgi:integron cassette Hfx-like protein
MVSRVTSNGSSIETSCGRLPLECSRRLPEVYRFSTGKDFGGNYAGKHAHSSRDERDPFSTEGFGRWPVATDPKRAFARLRRLAHSSPRACTLANHMPLPPHNVEIAKVAVDSAGQLSVQPLLPGDTDFAHIYRAAMDVRWDAASRQLLAPAAREWSQADWFKQIARAVRDEYGCVASSPSGQTGSGKMRDFGLLQRPCRESEVHE